MPSYLDTVTYFVVEDTNAKDILLLQSALQPYCSIIVEYSQ